MKPADEAMLAAVRKAVLGNETRRLSGMQRKLMAMTVQRDEWKERALRYRAQLLEKTNELT